MDRLIVTVAGAHVDLEASLARPAATTVRRAHDRHRSPPTRGWAPRSSTIATGGPGELAAINWILTQLERAGLGKDAGRALLRGLLQLRPRGRGGPLAPAAGADDASAAHWVGDLRAVDAARLPAVSAVLPELVALSDRDVFLTGRRGLPRLGRRRRGADPGRARPRLTGAPGGIRTPNLLIRSQMLYPLSIRAHVAPPGGSPDEDCTRIAEPEDGAVPGAGRATTSPGTRGPRRQSSRGGANRAMDLDQSYMSRRGHGQPLLNGVG